jgi:hypothetical protein
MPVELLSVSSPLFLETILQEYLDVSQKWIFVCGGSGAGKQPRSGPDQGKSTLKTACSCSSKSARQTA